MKSLRNEGPFSKDEDTRHMEKPVQFGLLEGSSAPSAQPSSIDLLRDVPLTVNVELGRTRKLVKEILKLNIGSIIPLDKEAGEPVDILVNNKVIAKGEVVEIEGNYGVRITELVSKG